LNAYYCMLFISRIRIRVRGRIRFSACLDSDYAHELTLISDVIVTLPSTCMNGLIVISAEREFT